MKEQRELIAIGIARVSGEITPDGVVYHDGATNSWWLTDEDDFARLGELLELGTPDAYSVWCSETVSQDLGYDYADASEETQAAVRTNPLEKKAIYAAAE